MKILKHSHFLLLTIFLANNAIALMPKKGKLDKGTNIDVSSNLPEECTRSGDVTDDLEIKCAKIRVELINFYKEFPKAVTLEQDKKVKSKKSYCEEVTETYVICHGNRYVLEVNAVANTYKKVKDVTDIIIKDDDNANAKKK